MVVFVLMVFFVFVILLLFDMELKDGFFLILLYMIKEMFIYVYCLYICYLFIELFGKLFEYYWVFVGYFK